MKQRRREWRVLFLCLMVSFSYNAYYFRKRSTPVKAKEKQRLSIRINYAKTRSRRRRRKSEKRRNSRRHCLPSSQVKAVPVHQACRNQRPNLLLSKEPCLMMQAFHPRHHRYAHNPLSPSYIYLLMFVALANPERELIIEETVFCCFDGS